MERIIFIKWELSALTEDERGASWRVRRAFQNRFQSRGGRQNRMAGRKEGRKEERDAAPWRNFRAMKKRRFVERSASICPAVHRPNLNDHRENDRMNDERDDGERERERERERDRQRKS